MDALHVTGKEVSSYFHKHMKSFVSDKGFVYVVLIMAKTEIPQDLKEVSKKISVLVNLIFDAAMGHSSRDFKQGF